MSSLLCIFIFQAWSGILTCNSWWATSSEILCWQDHFHSSSLVHLLQPIRWVSVYSCQLFVLLYTNSNWNYELALVGLIMVDPRLEVIDVQSSEVHSIVRGRNVWLMYVFPFLSHFHWEKYQNWKVSEKLSLPSPVSLFPFTKFKIPSRRELKSEKARERETLVQSVVLVWSLHLACISRQSVLYCSYC